MLVDAVRIARQDARVAAVAASRLSSTERLQQSESCSVFLERLVPLTSLA